MDSSSITTAQVPNQRRSVPQTRCKTFHISTKPKKTWMLTYWSQAPRMSPRNSIRWLNLVSLLRPFFSYQQFTLCLTKAKCSSSQLSYSSSFQDWRRSYKSWCFACIGMTKTEGHALVTLNTLPLIWSYTKSTTWRKKAGSLRYTPWSFLLWCLWFPSRWFLALNTFTSRNRRNRQILREGSMMLYQRWWKWTRSLKRTWQRVEIPSHFLLAWGESKAKMMRMTTLEGNSDYNFRFLKRIVF